MEGVVKLVEPVTNAVPPVADANQSTVFPFVTEADKTTAPVPYLVPLVPTGASTEALVRVIARVVAPVEETNAIPVGLPVAVDASRTDTLVDATLLPDLVMVRVLV